MGAGKSFAETDSWAVALAFFIFAVLSVLIERFVHHLKHHWLKGKKTLLEAGPQLLPQCLAFLGAETRRYLARGEVAWY